MASDTSPHIYGQLNLSTFPRQDWERRAFSATSTVQMLKCLPTMQETWVRSLGQEDPLEKEKTTHSSTLAWKIPWSEEPGGLQSMGSQRFGHDWATSLHFSTGATGYPHAKHEVGPSWHTHTHTHTPPKYRT